MKTIPDPDMLDGYDFSNGVRGKYAQRYAQGNILFQLNTTVSEDISPLAFEERARLVLSAYYSVELAPGTVPGIPKRFDMVSSDRQVVGDAKSYALVGGTRRPPAKLATISEYIWLLEKTGAPDTFLVFGNDRRVPELWLKDYSPLLSNVAFYFLHNDNRLEFLNRGQAVAQTR